MLVLAPAACCLAGVAVHEVLKVLMRSVRQEVEAGPTPAAVTPDAKKSVPVSLKKAKSATKVSPPPSCHSLAYPYLIFHEHTTEMSVCEMSASVPLKGSLFGCGTPPPPARPPLPS